MRLLFVYGTRPEAIKMAPLILATREARWIETEICLTGQHRQMLDQVNAFFGIEGNYDLALMKPNQGLASLTASCLERMDETLSVSRPDLVFIQGDTTTAMAGALAAFYRKIPVAHLEAGLRSGDRYNPFPEEINRTVAGRIAEWHFAPTERAAANLRREGVEKNVHVVGNTVIDALLLGLKLLRSQGEDGISKAFSFLDPAKRLILVTGHRRESFGGGFESICSALRRLAETHEEIQILYPVHLNPNVQEPVYRMLKGLDNLFLIPPVDYPSMIWLLEKSYFVLTDSGGIQEEAPALGKPVLVMRDVTERQEGVEAGTARLVGTKEATIVENAEELLGSRESYEKMAKAINPYGDGYTSERIIKILSQAKTVADA